MKISKVVCATLVSVAVSSSFADDAIESLQDSFNIYPFVSYLSENSKNFSTMLNSLSSGIKGVSSDSLNSGEHKVLGDMFKSILSKAKENGVKVNPYDDDDFDGGVLKWFDERDI